MTISKETQGKELACINKLGELFAMSRWTEEPLADMMELLRDYADSRAEEGYQAGYQQALLDARAVAEHAVVVSQSLVEKAYEVAQLRLDRLLYNR